MAPQTAPSATRSPHFSPLRPNAVAPVALSASMVYSWPARATAYSRGRPTGSQDTSDEGWRMRRGESGPAGCRTLPLTGHAAARWLHTLSWDVTSKC